MHGLNELGNSRASRPVALVTGGTGGIGSEACRRFAQQGYRVLFTYRSKEDQAKELTNQLGQLGAPAHGMQIDLADLRAAEELAGQISVSESRLDVFVHCAAALPRSSLHQTTNEAFLDCFKINCAAAFVLARDLHGLLAKRGDGAIVLVGSILGQVGAYRRSAYSASKAALIGLTRALAVELSPEVRVNAVMPGVFATEMNRSLLDDASALAATEARIPRRRLGTATECANVIVFLAGSESSYVTGAVFEVDGGLMARNPLPAGDPPA